MVNLKFIKQQLKTTWIVILLFALVFVLLIGMTLIGNPGHLLPRYEKISEYFSSEGGGAFSTVNLFLYGNGFVPLLLFGFFGLIMGNILISKDVNNGYISSWLTAPMSRTSIFNSKLLSLISATLFLNVWLIIMEMFVYGILFADFNLIVGPLLLGNLAMICFSLMIVSLTWICFAIFRKSAIVWGIILGLLGWSALAMILFYTLGFTAMKYFMIQSLFNSPFKHFGAYTPMPEDWPIHDQPYISYFSLILYAKDFAWQLPLMISVAAGLFTGGQFIIKNKDFTF